MTLAQLQSFVLVARHGSVKAAAAELEVTEPAVSVAVAALRRELGDELFVRNGRGIALTPGGRRLAALAGEILGLAEQARRSVAENSGAPRRLSVLATPLVAEHIGSAGRALHRHATTRWRSRSRGPRRVVRRGARAPARRHRLGRRRAPRRRSPPRPSCAAA
jgi:DNA-binding transcriptional LysR family regulator